MSQTDFNIALSLLRNGNSGMMRDLYPDLEPVFDLIEELGEEIEDLKERLEQADWD